MIKGKTDDKINLAIYKEIYDKYWPLIEKFKELQQENDQLISNFMNIKIKVKEYRNGHWAPEVFVKWIDGIAQKALEQK